MMCGCLYKSNRLKGKSLCTSSDPFSSLCSRSLVSILFLFYCLISLSLSLSPYLTPHTTPHRTSRLSTEREIQYRHILYIYIYNTDYQQRKNQGELELFSVLKSDWSNQRINKLNWHCTPAAERESPVVQAWETGNWSRRAELELLGHDS